MLAKKKWMSTYQSILFTTFFNKLNIRKCWNIKMNVSYVCNLHLFLHKIHIHASCLVLILRKTHWFKFFHTLLSPKTVINLTCKHHLLNRNGKRRLIMPVIIDDDNELFLWYGWPRNSVFSFPAGTIVRNSHHFKSLTRREQGLSQRRICIQTFLNDVLQ